MLSVIGFVVSCVTDSERNATYLAMGSFLPIVMLCGSYYLFIFSTILLSVMTEVKVVQLCLPVINTIEGHNIWP